MKEREREMIINKMVHHHQCCSKEKVKRGLWSPEEDEKLVSHITAHGHGCWSSVPKLAGLERCGKSCRLRWINYVRPDVKRGCFTEEEEMTIIDVHRILGNRWSQIAKHLPGRTDNEVKNFWNSCIKKKLLSQGLDPTTHNLLLSSSSSNINIITTFSVHQHSSSSTATPPPPPNIIINNNSMSTTPPILNNNNDHLLIINDPAPASSSTTLSGLVLINNSSTQTTTAPPPSMMFSSPSSTCGFTTSSSLLNHNFDNIINNFDHYSGVDPLPNSLQQQHHQISSSGLLIYNHHHDDDQLRILLNSSGIIHHHHQEPDYHQPNTNIHETFPGSITSHFADFDFVDSAFILPPPVYTTTTAHLDDDQRLAWDC